MNQMASSNSQDTPNVKRWEYVTDQGIAAVDLDRVGSKIVLGVLSSKVICLNEDGEELWIRNVHNEAWRVGISDDGNLIAIGTGNGIPFKRRKGVHFFSGGGEPIWFENLNSSSWGFSVSRDGNTIAVGTEGNNLIVIANTEQNEPQILWKEKGSKPWIYGWNMSTALSNDGKYILAGSVDNFLRLFNRKGLLIREIKSKKEVYTVAISETGRTIVAGDRAGYLLAVNFEGQILWEIMVEDGIWDVEVSRDGERIVVGADPKEGHVRVFNRDGTQLWRAFVQDSVSTVDIADVSYDVVIGTEVGYIYIFDSEGQLIDRYTAKGKIRDVAASDHGNLFVAVSMDQKAYGFKLPDKHVPAAKKCNETAIFDSGETFGSLFKKYREQTINPSTGRYLTQGALAEYLSNKLDLGTINVASISQWERDVHSIDHKNRRLLIGIIKALVVFNGIHSPQEADLMLRAGYYELLRRSEIRQIFGDI